MKTRSSEHTTTRQAPRQDRSLVLRGSRQARTGEAIIAAALPVVTRRLSRVCLWAGELPGNAWDLGDFRFGILEFSPVPEVALFVQWWSEPQEPVCVEVCSGRRLKAARPWITPAVHESLRRRGFGIGGGAGNFRREARVTSRQHVSALAREALDILVGEFEYDGRSPLRFKAERGTRAGAARVHEQVTPEEVGKLLACAERRATLLPRTDETATLMVEGPWPFSVSLSEQVEGQNLYREMVFAAPLLDAVQDEELARALLFVPGAQVREVDGARRLTMTVVLQGGVTTAFLLAALARWLVCLDTFGEAVDALLSRERPLFDALISRGGSAH